MKNQSIIGMITTMSVALLGNVKVISTVSDITNTRLITLLLKGDEDNALVY
jgi:hypothetical protein